LSFGEYPYNRQTVCALIAAFSFLVLSGYLLLWNHSNRDMRIMIGAAILFILGVLFSPRKDVTIFAAFLFVAIRLAFAAIITLELRAIIGTLIFLSVPVLMLYLEARKQKRIM
jgi:hypothetical protein